MVRFFQIAFRWPFIAPNRLQTASSFWNGVRRQEITDTGFRKPIQNRHYRTKRFGVNGNRLVPGRMD